MTEFETFFRAKKRKAGAAVGPATLQASVTCHTFRPPPRTAADHYVDCRDWIAGTVTGNNSTAFDASRSLSVRTPSDQSLWPSLDAADHFQCMRLSTRLSYCKN